MMYKSQITVVTFLILWINDVSSLNCYQCNSAVDQDCKEYFDWGHFDSLQVHSTKCEVDSAQYCIKTTGVYGGIVGTQRFCSSRDMFNQCQYVDFADHNRRYRACIYTCSTDGCNAALPSTSLPSHSLFICLSFVLLLVNYAARFVS